MTHKAEQRRSEILALLNAASNPVPLLELASDFQVDVRTIRRDIRQFASDGVGVQVLRGRRGGAVLGATSDSESAGVKTRLPLVGRQTELTSAISHLRDGDADSLGVLLVHGDAGVGKTRFLNELEYRLKPDFESAWGRCSETSQTEGLEPWNQVLRSLGAPGLIPEVSTSEGEDPLANEGRVLIAAVEQLRHAAQTPSIAFIDDFHRADSASLRLLFHLMNFGRDLPLKVVIAYRGSTEENAPVAQAMEAELAGDSAVAQLALSRLNDTDIALLVRSTDKSISPEDIEQISNQSAGIPLFVEELLAERDLGPTVRTRTLSQLISEKMNRLSHLTGRFMAMASARGRYFSPHEVGEPISLDSDRIAMVLTEAADLGIVEVDPMNRELWRFRHELIYRGVYDQIPDLEKEVLHRSWADLLTSRSPIPVMQVVEHLERSPVFTQARQLDEYRVRAGEDCIGRLAWSEGRSLFLSVLRSSPEQHLDSLNLARAHAGLGRCAYGLDLAPEAVEHFSLAFDLYVSIGMPAEAINLALIPVHGPVTKQVVELTGKALAICAPDSLQRGWLLSRSVFRARRTKKLLVDLDEANRIARIHQDKELEMWNEGRRAQFLIQSLDLATGKKHATRAVRLASRTSDLEGAMHCHHWLAAAHFRSGSLEAAFAADQESLELALRSHNRSRVNLANRGLLRDELISGAFGEASSRLEWLLNHHTVPSFGPLGALLRAWTGDTAAAVDQIDEELSKAAAKNRDLLLSSVASCAVWMMDIGVETEAYSASVAWLRRQSHPDDPFMRSHHVNLVAARGLLATQVDDKELALKTLRELDSLQFVFGGDASVPEGFVPPFSFDRIRARLLVTLGEEGKAESYFRDALESTRSAGAFAEYLLTSVDFLSSQIDSVEFTNVREPIADLEFGLELAKRLSMKSTLSALRTISRKVREMSAASFNFTQREHHVARSLVRGLRNSEIATSLFISERTVAGHVTRILSKTNSRTRAEAVAKILSSGTLGSPATG